MKKLIYTKDMQTEEWLNYRRLGIGGSDASTILGLNPFNSILRLWEDKTGRIPVEEKENEYTRFGHVMEPVIRKEFERHRYSITCWSLVFRKHMWQPLQAAIPFTAM